MFKTVPMSKTHALAAGYVFRDLERAQEFARSKFADILTDLGVDERFAATAQFSQLADGTGTVTYDEPFAQVAQGVVEGEQKSVLALVP